ncbi:hypothetical protein AB7M17_003778 [Bradyrhizobium sp. USDA 377]
MLTCASFSEIVNRKHLARRGSASFAVDTPVNTLEADTLCPGSAVLDKINASLR